MRILVGIATSVLIGVLPAPSTAEGPVQSDVKFKLAREYATLMHRSEIIRDAWSRQLKLSWPICRTTQCQRDLGKAIDDSVAKRVGPYEDKYAALLASRLSEADLRAAVAFAKSAQGQALARAQVSASAEIGDLGHDVSVAVQVDVSKAFCPRHADICRPGQPSFQRPTRQ